MNKNPFAPCYRVKPKQLLVIPIILGAVLLYFVFRSDAIEKEYPCLPFAKKAIAMDSVVQAIVNKPVEVGTFTGILSRNDTIYCLARVSGPKVSANVLCVMRDGRNGECQVLSISEDDGSFSREFRKN